MRYGTDTVSVTYKCDGCGGRFPAAEQWFRTEASRAHLEAGRFYAFGWVHTLVAGRGKRQWLMIPQVCSAACAALATEHTVRAWWSTQYPKYTARRVMETSYTRFVRQAAQEEAQR